MKLNLCYSFSFIVGVKFWMLVVDYFSRGVMVYLGVMFVSRFMIVNNRGGRVSSSCFFCMG